MLKRAAFSFLSATILCIASANSSEIKYWHSEHYRGFEYDKLPRLTDHKSSTDITEIRLCFDDRPLSENQSGLATGKDKVADFCQHFRDDPLLENSIDPSVSKQIRTGVTIKKNEDKIYTCEAVFTSLSMLSLLEHISRDANLGETEVRPYFSSGNMLSIVQKVQKVLLGDDYINLYWNYAGKPRVSSASIPETSQCFQTAFSFYWEKIEQSCIDGVFSMTEKEVGSTEYKSILKEHYDDLRNMLGLCKKT
ncbi:hypothetical protein [Roseibium aggregatum]|uniref:Uncharacterized protein n=1 Tax=Roseibium aggregatum TaxID=187304 RepID=A0A0M6YCZ5_9HYPH|nr:hypothetical protein [Roseibium aggregatum]CTQ47574.1 hypothetical protein LAL4801_06036 [Roseibium aggregatum]